jgi:anaerobic selenocysteine-containing dehydrogenase
MLLLLEEEQKNPGTVFDKQFIQQHTSGFEEFIQNLQQQSFQQCAELSGVDEQLIREAAKLIQQKNRSLFAGQWV